MTDGLTLKEIAEKIGMSQVAVKNRVYKRGIMPYRIVGTVGLYREEDIDKIKEELPTGRRSPKYGKIRSAIGRANDELAQIGFPEPGTPQ